MLSSFHVVISVAVTVVTVAVELTEVSCEAELSSSRSLLQSKVDLVPPKAMVFYNLFAENIFQVPRIAKIARGQLALVDPKHYDLSINSIGAITDVSQLALDPLLAQRTRFVHYMEGQETLTLHDVWSYCRRHDVLPSQVVVYVHSKGSYHPHEFQDQWRDYVTAGALSQECRLMPEYCNMCSSRMSPVPYPHSPGNMWAARCGYISELMDPKDFETATNNFQKEVGPVDLQCPTIDGCQGLGRVSTEHWVQSHPQLQPCDLDEQRTYTWGLPHAKNLPAVVNFVHHPKILKPAPRFDGDAFQVDSARCGQCGRNMLRRLLEYSFFYKKHPKSSWWGWKFFGHRN
ncbi:unnamed protein product [Cladocopium goreaui]|uniref:Secreted protein n=1 Tax=Cladocopium goreaui TaxID=2562237 RepID=A0A9P1C312_9DINO|nr:unnamed protein product [Cladocopium goreaui]